ncbi:hypothetical protein HAZT_HAZT008815 [Hyalella azteca]|nr:hypothetical protein HAZT_HAZT008815 [Hyalella azteca]
MMVLLLHISPASSAPVPEDNHLPAVANDPYEKRPPKLKKSLLSPLYKKLYPFYDRPRYRYPYYDAEGNGELLYGYGGKRLYSYSVFLPVEGYYRK